MIALAVIGSCALLAWLAILLRPSRPWDLKPVAEDEYPAPPPDAWPSVRILVPARNEAESLPRTLPALLAQEYPGDWKVVVVDDRSTDGTAELARGLGATVITGAALPDGWVGKVWALQQGAAGATERYLLLTDADILHVPGSLKRLVMESKSAGLALNSRMARLRCVSAAERLLIPAFVWFFSQLYPLRRVNDPADPLAAAAGGCELVHRETLEKAGGFASIRNELIDDVALARRLKPQGPIRLSLCRGEVQSLRAYGTIGPIWRMVRRTAFTELRHSWLRLAGALLALLLLFAVPAAVTVAALACQLPQAALPSGLALLVMALVYRPAPRFFGLSGFRAFLLPIAGLLYGAMTLDSALRGGRKDWR